jgi:hypothetical protein
MFQARKQYDTSSPLKRERAEMEAVNDIWRYLGLPVSKRDQTISMVCAALCSEEHSAMLLGLAGIEGFPVEAWRKHVRSFINLPTKPTLTEQEKEVAKELIPCTVEKGNLYEARVVGPLVNGAQAIIFQGNKLEAELIAKTLNEKGEQ